MLTRIVYANVNLPFTETSGKALLTYAGEIIYSVHTGPMLAEIGRTIVAVDLASRSSESGRAFACVTVERVPACAPVVARVARTFVDILLAIFSSEAIDASAVVPVDTVGAISVVLARVRVALVIVNLAVFSLKS